MKITLVLLAVSTTAVTHSSVKDLSLRHAEATCAVADAEQKRQQLVLNAVQALYDEGNASDQELLTARLNLESSSARAQANRNIVEFLRINVTSKPAAANDDVSPRWIVLKLPGLGDLGISASLELIIPVQREDIAKFPRRRSRNGPTRSSAWQELVQRIATMNLSRLNARELELANAKTEVAAAYDRLETLRVPAVWLSHSIDGVFLGEREFTTMHEFRRAISEFKSREFMESERSISELWLLHHNQMLERLRRVGSAVRPGEFDQHVALRQEMRQRIHRLNERISSLSGSKTITLASSHENRHETASRLFGRPIDRDTLRIVKRTVHRQLLHMIDAKRLSETAAGQETVLVQKLTELAVRDDWFKSELQSARRRSVLATANYDLMSHQLSQLQLTFEFLEGLAYDCQSRNSESTAAADELRNWKAVLQELIVKESQSTAVQSVLDAELKIEENKTEYLTRLHELGHAGWKKTAASQVRLAELKRRQFSDREERLLYSASLKPLRTFLSDFDAEVSDRVVASFSDEESP